ncbi:MAG TPA: Gfo/Idh/MocA family oxidoreductase [Bryobacteraceae bacterium]|nr:Gfo/Idh/MocA family oxidoreductase [Bryobacteraceae bacterium]
MNVVMIGAGYFAQFHADAWNRIPGLRIAAVADPDRDRASAFAARWKIPAVYANAEDAIRRERPAFVDIVTRPETHLELTALAAAHCVPIICQKPMAGTASECEEMVRVCEDAGVRLVIHENWRWQPWYREVRRLIDAGTLGTVFHLGFRMRTGDGRGPEPYTAQPYFRTMPRLLIYETLVHFLDTFRFLAGEIESVYCVTRHINPVIAGEDCAVIELRFATGARGLIDANRISGPTEPEVAFGELSVEGERGAVRLAPDGSLWLSEYPGAARPHSFAAPEEGYKGDSVKAMQEHFVECLRTARPAETEGRAYLRTVALVEACYRSADSGRPESC